MVLTQALVAPEERMSKPQLNARNCLNSFLPKVIKERVSFPSIVVFGNEIIKSGQPPVTSLHTFFVIKEKYVEQRALARVEMVFIVFG